MLARDQLEAVLQQFRPSPGEHTQHLSGPQFEIYSLYERGLHQLLDRMKRDHPRYREAFVYQQQLSENITKAQQYADTPTDKAERAIIVDQLNGLAISALGTSFNTLCGLSNSGPTQELSADLSHDLVLMDRRLRKHALKLSIEELPSWRLIFQPPDEAWWWFLDKQVEAREKENDLPWLIVAGTPSVLTITLATEIIRRLWTGAPDSLSIFGTLLTLIITASPLFKQGRELAEWLLKRISWLKPHFRAEAMAGMSVLAFITVLAAWLLLPQLAILYNNWGYDALRAGHPTTAQRYFQRAVALNPDLAEGYYDLADVYERIGRPDEAITWYQRALEHDLTLGPAYNNLGRLYILRDDPQGAIRILQAGLSYVKGNTSLDLVTRYRLLSNLGRAYFHLRHLTRARSALEQAVRLEQSMDVAFKSAVPHYYLAQTYETAGQMPDALQQWEQSQRYLDGDASDQAGWEEIINSHLHTLREKIP